MKVALVLSLALAVALALASLPGEAEVPERTVSSANPDPDPDPDPVEGEPCISEGPSDPNASYVYEQGVCVIAECSPDEASSEGYYRKLVPIPEARCELMPWVVFDVYIPSTVWADFPLSIPITVNTQFPLSSYDLEITYDPDVLHFVQFTPSGLHNAPVVNPGIPGKVYMNAVGHSHGTSHEDIQGTQVPLGTLDVMVHTLGPEGAQGVLSGRVASLVNVGSFSWAYGEPIWFHDGAGGYKETLDLSY